MIVLKKGFETLNNFVIKTQAFSWLLMFVITIVLIVQSTYWIWFDDEAPLTYNSSQFIAGGPGQPANIVFNVTRSRFCDGRVYRWLEDSTGNRYYLPTVYLDSEQLAELERKSPGKITVTVDIPHNFAEGVGKYVAQTEYMCNPLQKYFPIKTTGTAYILVTEDNKSHFVPHRPL
jgi:hypothetical protein